ncbi:MAG TPA: nuclear transport factor 2 family protein, partial [Solirubrobacteraceae bacterium]|nr:nuclear transport factor 2 family protein [Solirubrobacteraceae bacterium]
AAERAREHYAAKQHEAGLARAAALAGGGPVALPPAQAEPSDQDDEAPIPVGDDQAGAGHAHTRLERLLAESLRCLNERDWDGLRRIYSPAYRVVDHRPNGADMDLEQTIAAFDASHDLVRDVRWTRLRFLARSEHVAASILMLTGRLGEGGPVEIAYGNVIFERDGVLAGSELFEPEDEDVILARYEELVAESDPVRLAPGVDASSPAVAALRAQCAAFNARDWDGYRALQADDYVTVDHRSLGWGEPLDAERAIETAKSAVAVAPDLRMTTHVLAASGNVAATVARVDGHALDGGGTVEFAFGSVVLVEDGRARRAEMFDGDDREAILARYEELRAPDAVDPSHPMVRLWETQRDTANRSDWAAFAALFTEDFRGIDHRPIGWDVVEGPHGVVELVRTARAQSDARLSGEVVAAAKGVSLRTHKFSGHAAAGSGAFEVEFDVVTVARDGRVAAEEFFAPEDRAAARARFDELCSAPATTRILERYVRCFERRDWKGLRTLYRDDFSVVDRRHPALWEFDGPDDLATQLRMAWEQEDIARWTSVRAEVLVADDRVLAFRQTLPVGSPDGPGEIVAGIVAVVEGGLVARAEVFEPDDDEAMLARFEELRALPAEEREPPVVAARRRFTEAFEARDWDALTALHADDVVVVDRRPLGFGEVRGRAGVGRLAAGLAAVGADRWRSTTLAARGERLALFAEEVSSAGGSGEVRVLLQVDADGRIWRDETFAAEDEGVARGRLDRLAEIDAWNVAQLGAYDRGEWEAVAATLAPDVVLDYHPAGHRSVGRDAALAQLRTAYDPSAGIACLADRVDEPAPVVCSRRETWRGTDGSSGVEWEAVVESLFVLDEEGRMARVEAFLPGDPRIGEAIERLAKAAAQREVVRSAEDPVSLAPGIDPRHPAVEATRAQCLAFNRRDWAAVRALFAPGYEAFDHRPVGWERLDLDLLIETGHTAVAAAPDMTTTAELLACGHAITARIQHYRGHALDGGGLLDVSQGEIAIYDDEGRVACEEFFDADDRESLMARYEELRARTDNVAVRVRERFTAAFEARDWEALRALYADDAVSVDHRPLGFGEESGIAGVVGLVTGAADVGMERWESEPIAWSGPRLALFAERVSAGAPAGVAEQCVLVQLDGDGRIWRTDVFPDEAAARERLAALGALDELCAAHLANFAARDWDGVAATLAPEIVFEYHPLGQRFAGHDEVVAYFRSVFDPSAAVRCDFDRLDLVAPGVASRRERWSGHEPATGADWDVVIESLFTVDAAGRVLRVEALPPGDPRRDEAIERLAATATQRA